MKYFYLPFILLTGVLLGGVGGWAIFAPLPSASKGPTIVAKTIPAIPYSIYIRGHAWNIITQDKSNDKIMSVAGVDGLTDCKRHDIFLSDYQSSSSMRNSFIHELLHAGTCADGDVHNLYWNSSSEDAHEGIYRLADYLSDLFHENPQLTKYLAGE